MSTCRLSLLGGFVLTDDAGAALALPTRKDRLLLSYLALHAGRPQRRETLIGLLWADRGEDQARGSLRQSLAALRETLRKAGCEPITADRDTAKLRADGLRVDVLDFLQAVASADRQIEALSLYTGSLLQGVESPTGEFDDWLREERQQLEKLAAGAVVALSLRSLDRRDAEGAARMARDLLTRDRLNEALYRALMRLQLRLGERSAALKTYAECRDALKGDLGVAPELETEQLYRDILTDRLSSHAATAPAASAVDSSRPAIAVMPLANISGEERLAPFCEGLAEEIITGLGRFQLLDVIDRNSSSAVAKLSTDTADIGRQLGVTLVVQGSLQRLGDRIRITIRLTGAPDRRQIWSDVFECSLDEVATMPETISRAVVARLHGRVERSLVERSRHKPKLAAYELVLRGIVHIRGYGPDDNQRAVDLFQQALDIDPDYAVARAYRGFADVVLHGYGASPPEVLQRARAMTEAAVMADPDNSRCRWLHGLTLAECGDIDGELRQYERALALNPYDTNVLASIGAALGSLGRFEEGIANVREAMRLDPYHPEWYWIDLGSLFYMSGRYADAIECYMHRTKPMVWLMARLAACHAQLGQMAEASRLVAEVLRIKPEFTISGQRSGAWLANELSHIKDGLRKAGFPE